MSKAKLIHGDVVERLRKMKPSYFDAVICDPPYGLSKHPNMEEVLRHWLNGDDYNHTASGFMSMRWDSFVPGPSNWREVLRILKPGGFALVFAGTRTMDLMGLSLRLAGFEVRDTLSWLFGSGFPKSRNIGKAIDEKQGNKSSGDRAASEEAACWSGHGTALKPAYEPIIVAMKPLDGTYADNALAHGVAGINIDGARITTHGKDAEDHQAEWDREQSAAASGNLVGANSLKSINLSKHKPAGGRWPANVILQHHPDCTPTGETTTTKGRALNRHTNGANPWGNAKGKEYTSEQTPDEQHEVWDCHPDCPVRLLDEQSGTLTSGKPGRKWSGNTGAAYGAESRPPGTQMSGWGDSGGVSRFFYQAKVAKRERNKGCEKLHWVTHKGQLYRVPHKVREKAADRLSVHKARVLDGNVHPTMKPLDLCRYLATMLLPSSGRKRRVLVPFCGSGSEVIGALLAGWEYVVGIEQSAAYLRIADRRLRAWSPDTERIVPDLPVPSYRELLRLAR